MRPVARLGFDTGLRPKAGSGPAGTLPRSSPTWRGGLRLALVALATLVLQQPASAQFFFFQKYFGPPVVRRAPPPQHRVHRSEPHVAARKAPPSDSVAAKPKADDQDRPLVAVVSIEDQHVSVYGANGLIERSDVSTGMPGHATPTGVFAVIGKERWHESNLYSGAPMPFMQRITWSGVAMHQGQLPGYPASHGCIRLGGEFAERWYKATRLGLRVLIAPSDIEPLPIAHPNLPEPRYWPAPAEFAAAGGAVVQSAALSDAQWAEFAAPRPVLLNPVTYAAAEKQKAKAELKDAEKDEGQAGDALEAAGNALKDATKAGQSAARVLAQAEDRASWFGLTGQRLPPPIKTNYGDGLMSALDAFQRARSDAAEAERALARAQAQFDATSEAQKRAEERTEALKARVSEMGRRAETVSIFISRKEQRLYVRQALKPVFDVPVTIKNPDEPLGTHVYSAAAPGPSETALRWTAYTMPIERLGKPLATGTHDRSADDVPSIGTSVMTESAAGALSRIELSGEVRDKLAELVWTGASLIISDHGLSPETGLGTDFVVETKH